MPCNQIITVLDQSYCSDSHKDQAFDQPVPEFITPHGKVFAEILSSCRAGDWAQMLVQLLEPWCMETLSHGSALAFNFLKFQYGRDLALGTESPSCIGGRKNSSFLVQGIYSFHALSLLFRRG